MAEVSSTHILLTGAGFSHNWGGWLASEAFEYLLGCPEIDEGTRQLLWRSKENKGGFEDTLADLQSARDDEAKKRFVVLTTTLVGMFNAMGDGFAKRRFEFAYPPEITYCVETFLSRFNAMFTLNQDTLIERYYLGRMLGTWNGGCCYMPGLKPLPRADASILPSNQIASWQPEEPANFRLSSGQPYIKLHGSCNWGAGSPKDRLLIMGGQKAISIDRFPILSWYHREFRSFLSRANARLMVIGYSFSDKHINDAIGEGVERGLKIFIIDPLGVDVLDKRQNEPVGRGNCPARC